MADGSRVGKTHPRVEAIGDLDELNSLLGMLCLFVPGGIRTGLRGIQRDLFSVGAVVADPASGKGRVRVGSAAVAKLEREIGRLNSRLKPLSGFILPGGTPGSAWAHLARCVARRAERRVAGVKGKPGGNPECLRYLNRLSDYLFVLGRFLNDKGKKDLLWRPPSRGRKRFRAQRERSPHAVPPAGSS
jgi:cob(I)alamin adenosyltransferase